MHALFSSLHTRDRIVELWGVWLSAWLSAPPAGSLRDVAHGSAYSNPPKADLLTTTAAFPNSLMGRLPRTTFRGLQRSHDITACLLATPPSGSPLSKASIRLWRSSSTAAPIRHGGPAGATLCRVGITPTEEPRLFTSHRPRRTDCLSSGPLRGRASEFGAPLWSARSWQNEQGAPALFWKNVGRISGVGA